MNLTQYLEFYVSKADFNSRMSVPVTNTIKSSIGAPEWLKEYMANNRGMKFKDFKERMKRNALKIRKNKLIPSENQRLVMTKNGIYYVAMGMSLTHSMIIDHMVYDGIFKIDRATFNYDDLNNWWCDGTDEFICLITLRDFPKYAFLSESYEFHLVKDIQNDFKSKALNNMINNLSKIGLQLIPAQVFDYDTNQPTPKQLIKKYSKI